MCQEWLSQKRRRTYIRFRSIKLAISFSLLNSIFWNRINYRHLHVERIHAIIFWCRNCLWTIDSHHQYSSSSLELNHIFPSKSIFLQDRFIVLVKDFLCRILNWILFLKVMKSKSDLIRLGLSPNVVQSEQKRFFNSYSVYHCKIRNHNPDFTVMTSWI